MLAAKLGLRDPACHEPQGADPKLGGDSLQLLGLVETDMTLFFRSLMDVPVEPASEPSADDLLRPLRRAYYDPTSLVGDARERTLAWLRRYVALIRRDALPRAERLRGMQAANPKYILRNYLAQLAIDAAERDDAAPLAELLDVLRSPYDEQPAHEKLAQKRPDWARDRAGCSRLSCSS